MSLLTCFFFWRRRRRKDDRVRGRSTLAGGIKRQFLPFNFDSHFAVRLLRSLLSLAVLNESKRSAEKQILLSLRKMVVFSCGVMTLNVADFQSMGCVWGLKPCVYEWCWVLRASVKVSFQSNVTADVFVQSHAWWNISGSWLLCFVVDQLMCCVLICRLSVADLRGVCNVSPAQLRPSGQVSMTWTAPKLGGIT